MRPVAVKQDGRSTGVATGLTHGFADEMTFDRRTCMTQKLWQRYVADLSGQLLDRQFEVAVTARQRFVGRFYGVDGEPDAFLITLY